MLYQIGTATPGLQYLDTTFFALPTPPLPPPTSFMPYYLNRSRWSYSYDVPSFFYQTSTEVSRTAAFKNRVIEEEATDSATLNCTLGPSVHDMKCGSNEPVCTVLTW